MLLDSNVLAHLLRTGARAGTYAHTAMAVYHRLRELPPNVAWLCSFEKDAKGAQRFHVCQSIAEVERTMGGSIRRWHEVQYGDRPVKLWVDVDAKEGDGDAIVAAVRDGVEREMSIAFGANLPSPHEWTADRPGKISRHLIWDVWMKDMEELKRFVTRAVSLMPSFARATVDPNYHSMKTLRLPYSTKYDGSGALVPHDGSKDFDMAKMLGSTLTLHRGIFDDPRLPPAPTLLLEYPKTESSESTERGESEMSLAHEVCKALGVTLLANQTSRHGVFLLKDKLVCPVAGREHKSNHCAIVIRQIDKGLVTKYKCLDADCRGATWPTRDVSSLAWSKEERRWPEDEAEEMKRVKVE